nr:hypothetical protein Iba_chr03dCG12690 [Ipomoea batatas]
MRIGEGGSNQIIIRGKLNINFSPVKKIIYHRWTKVIPVPPQPANFSSTELAKGNQRILGDCEEQKLDLVTDGLRSSSVTHLRQSGGNLRHRGGWCSSRQRRNSDALGDFRSSWRRGFSSVNGGGVRVDDDTRQRRNSGLLGDVGGRCRRDFRGPAGQRRLRARLRTGQRRPRVQLRTGRRRSWAQVRTGQRRPWQQVRRQWSAARLRFASAERTDPERVQ